MFKKIILILLSISVLFSSLFLNVTANTDLENFTTKNININDKYEEICNNDNFALYLNMSEYDVALVDKRTSKIWYSNPVDRKEDKIATGKNKMALNAAFEVTYRDIARDVADSVNTYTSSVMNNAVKVEKGKNSLKIYYRFDDIKAIIPLQYKLNSDGISCSILSNQIRESNEFPILSVNLLSYFGAGSLKDNGYILVPDGSGALINFNNGKQEKTAYSQKLYGRDETFDVSSLSINTETARLPIFAIKNNEDAFLAVITEGEALAAVNANVSGKLSSYNRVYASFSLRMMDTYTMGQGTGSTGSQITIYEEGSIKKGNLTVRYFPLLKENSDYNGMAKKYREYLIEKNKLDLKKSDQGLHLEFMGAIRVKDYFLGVPYNKNVALTDTNAIIDIISDILKSADISVDIKYTDWNKASIKGGVNNRATALSAIGGKSGIKKIENEFKSKNVDMYLDTDYYSVEDFPAFNNKANSGVTTLYGKPLSLYDFSFIDYFKDPYSTKHYLISFRKTENYAEKFIKSFSKSYKGLNVSLGNLSSAIYSDYSVEGWSRQDSVETAEKVAAILSKNSQLMVKGGNEYVIGKASAIINAPEQSSNFNIEDEQIPFYSLTMNGIVDYSYNPLNLSSNQRQSFLRAVETGASLNFLWVDKNEKYLKDEGFSSYYSVKAESWIDSAKKYAEEFCEINNVTDGTLILKHQKITDGVYKTVYENGSTVLVNYNSKNVVVDGKTVEAENYLLLKGSAAE